MLANRKEQLGQFIRYCIVGVLNTLVTLGVIYLCKSMLGWNLYVSNALGYIAGVTNSFFCNKQWTFRSKGRYRREAVRFVAGFGICYALQFVRPNTSLVASITYHSFWTVPAFNEIVL